MNKPDKWMEPILWAMSGPMLAMPGYETDKPPENIMTEIKIGRLLMAAAQHKELASEAETMWYISTYTFTQPPSHDWYEIYLYLFNRVMKDKVTPDLKFDKELNDQQKQLLGRLQEWLYKKSMEALRSKLKQQEKEEHEKANPSLLNFFKDEKNKGI